MAGLKLTTLSRWFWMCSYSWKEKKVNQGVILLELVVLILEGTLSYWFTSILLDSEAIHQKWRVQFQNKPMNYRAWNFWILVSSEPGELDGWHTSSLNHLNPIIIRLVIQIQSRKKVGSKYIVWLVSSKAGGGGGKRHWLAWRVISTPELCWVTKGENFKSHRPG